MALPGSSRWIIARSFSALQRAEIAEIHARRTNPTSPRFGVSVLFNEPKLLKLRASDGSLTRPNGFSALQRAEIAEIMSTRLPAI